ncbi:hypothetical protein DL96DRAFT_1498714 [Flagelloscypha sp. PMI_526]|nr:hypothetical protein DL96DRAFT_1498714 [Flagelloscypha sp. PMI_526]
MQSARGREAQSAQSEAEIRAQIEKLQSLLPGGSSTASLPHSPPRKRRAPHNQLVPATPSPKKKRRLSTDDTQLPSRRSSVPNKVSSTVDSRILNDSSVYPPKAPSILSKVVEMQQRGAGIGDGPSDEVVERSSGFSEAPARPPQNSSRRTRDENLAVIEELLPGPYDHTPPVSDPLFTSLEPNSGIRLSSRSLSHEDLQAHLTARYYLSPSRLYSCVRLLPNKQAYDVPVCGDWVTIAVVAERGPVKHSRAPVTAITDGPQDPSKRKNPASDEDKGPSGKKFVNIKLVDFGARSSKSSEGGVATIRGDACLSLLLFESDGFDLVKENGKQPKKIYRGGSRGAYESMAKLKEGDVIALLNPRILKPFQRSADRPHPTTNVLAVTPESASSIEIIGTSKDLGLCNVTKRDGKRCNSWCDKRLSDVCEFHVQAAIQSRRAGRAEFSSSTSGLSTTAQKRKQPATDYDPRKKWGLAPAADAESSSTYIVSGHVVNASQMHVGETVGREAQARAQRKGKNGDKELMGLLERDKDGMKTVLKAREAERERLERLKANAKGKRKDSSKEAASTPKETTVPPRAKIAYSVSIIKGIGFDPTLKPGERRINSSALEDKLSQLSATQSNRKVIALGRRPGTHIRSGVVVPLSSQAMNEHNGMVDLDDF